MRSLFIVCLATGVLAGCADRRSSDKHADSPSRRQGSLDLRIAPPASDEHLLPGIDQLRAQGPATAPAEGDYMWLPVAAGQDVTGVITGQWVGRTYVLVSNKAGEKMLSSQGGWSIIDASLDKDERGEIAINFQLNDSGGNLMRELTGRNVLKPLAIIVEGRVYSAPVVRSAIGDRGVITGKFTPEEARRIVATLNN